MSDKQQLPIDLIEGFCNGHCDIRYYVKKAYRDSLDSGFYYDELYDSDCGEWTDNRKTEDAGAYYYLVPRYCEGGDYSGGTVEKANHRAFMMSWECCEGVFDVSGGHGTFSVAISVNWLVEHWGDDEDDTARKIVDCLIALDDYPVIDDDVLSELEIELSDEAWDYWAKDDYVQGVEKHLGVALEILDDQKSKFVAMFSDVCGRENEYWEADGPDMWIRLEPIVEATTLRDLAPFVVDWEDNVDPRLTDPCEGQIDFLEKE